MQNQQICANLVVTFRAAILAIFITGLDQAYSVFIFKSIALIYAALIFCFHSS